MEQEPIGEINEQKHQNTFIEIKHGDEVITLDLNNLRELFQDIEEFNSHFGLGKMLARTIIEQKEESGEITPLSDEDESQKRLASVIDVTHRPFLENIGLSIEPVSGKKFTIMSADETAAHGEIRINVADRKKLIDFLSALTAEHIEKTEVKPYLESLAEMLAQQVADHYDPENASEEMVQLLGGLEKIVTEYQRLGMDNAVGKLSNYLVHSKQGDFREFLAIERKGLLSEPGKSFGPADWQRDSSPESLRKGWEEALDILEKTKQNPKAEVLYQSLHAHLLQCVAIALKDTDLMDRLDKETKEQFKSILSDANFRILAL